jgi:hypothetical protein
LNERVAKHYGVTGITGPEVRRVDLSAFPQRGGLLTQGTILAGTSTADDTSVVKRGVWVLSQLLCSAPHEPPPGVDVIKAEADPTMSKRQRLEQHRSDSGCAGCHAAMDPIGFGLENYDVTGAWRTEIGPHPIDASGQLLGGASFSGPREMFAALKTDPRLNECVTKALYTYALGRTIFPEDECAVRNAALTAAERGGGLKDLISTLAASRPFRFQGAETETGAQP